MECYKTIKSFDNTEIFYRINRKERQFLVFIHGIAGNHTSYMQQLHFFEEKDYSTIALDLRGHGNSEIPYNRNFSKEAMARDVLAILKRENIHSATIVGHCYGAVIGLVIYKLFPERVDGMIIINSTYTDPLTGWKVYNKQAKALIKSFYKANLSLSRYIGKKKNRSIDFVKYKGLPNSIIIAASTFMFTNLAAVSSCHIQFLDFEGTDTLKSLKIRALILAGKGDTFFPLDISKKMKEITPHCELRIINRGKHLTILKAPQEVNHHIYDFMHNDENLSYT
jgi:pimeloyl-ACP methyl ester carboxylesterase